MVTKNLEHRISNGEDSFYGHAASLLRRKEVTVTFTSLISRITWLRDVERRERRNTLLRILGKHEPPLHGDSTRSHLSSYDLCRKCRSRRRYRKGRNSAIFATRHQCSRASCAQFLHKLFVSCETLSIYDF